MIRPLNAQTVTLKCISKYNAHLKNQIIDGSSVACTLGQKINYILQGDIMLQNGELKKNLNVAKCKDPIKGFNFNREKIYCLPAM